MGIKIYHTPRMRYSQTKQNAKYRGEEWDFEFEDWILMWMERNFWAKKGNGPGQLKMYRIDAALPWSKDNAVIGSKSLQFKGKNKMPASLRPPINYGAGHSAKCKPIIGDGTKYYSIREAARQNNFAVQTIQYRLKHDSFPGWQYLDE